jgi:hypothetical protein
MTIKKGQVDGVVGALGFLGDFTGACLAYFVAINLQRLQPILVALGNARKPVPGAVQHERQHQALCVEYADRDEKGRPIYRRAEVPGGVGVIYDIHDRQGEYEEALNKLNEQSRDIQQAQMKQAADVRALLEQEIDVELVTIKASECPEEAFTGNVVAVLMAAGLLEWDIQTPGASTEA